MKDSLYTIFHGHEKDRNLLKGKNFFMADTPDFLVLKGLKGGFFSIKYGVITRHMGKDADHRLGENDWLDLCETIKRPFLVTRHNNNFNLYTGTEVNGKNCLVGVLVDNNLGVNKVVTAFGVKVKKETDTVLYISEKLTPEQIALIGETNLRLYLSAGGNGAE
ncbi:MAG: hypothetical protein LBG72_00550 [Spirochaetaceae bacterium]|nr:hypothetical protein [Spirochaetaceae bacterium]